jgi:hypothetical protein
MKRLLLDLWLVTATVAGAQPAIIHRVLNPREVVVVPVATDRLTTICFPGPIAQIEAAYVSTNDEPPLRFQLTFQPGQFFFSLRALLPGAAASLNVIYKQQVHVFELVSSPQPILALTLTEPEAEQPRSPRGPAGAHRLLGLLDTAKAYALLRDQHPDEVRDVVCVPRNDRYQFQGYALALEEVFRFAAEDALVFRVVLQNAASAPLRYLPQSFRVRAGDQTFYAALTDGDGTVPPLTNAAVYFAVTSGPEGSPHHLSPQNDFLVLVTVPESPDTPPAPAPADLQTPPSAPRVFVPGEPSRPAVRPQRFGLRSPKDQ